MKQKKCTKNSFEGVFEVKEKFNLFDWPFTLSWLSEDVTTQNKIIYIIIMCCRQVDELFSVPEKTVNESPPPPMCRNARNILYMQ